MSTRATYTIIEGTPTKKITFYIHHDGYEKGAADYFLNAIVKFQENNAGRLIENFIRGNCNAKIIESRHDYGSSYDYSLNLKTNTITIYDNFNKINKSFDFIEWLNKYNDVKVLKYNNQIHTTESINKLIKEYTALKLTWMKNGNDNGLNFKMLIEKIEDLEKIFYNIH